MYLSMCFELIEAIFCGITITSFSHPTGFIVCSVHPNGHFCSDWQDMLYANCKTPAWYTVSPASVILLPQAETSAWEGVERMHSSSQVPSLAGEALTCLVYWDQGLGERLGSSGITLRLVCPQGSYCPPSLVSTDSVPMAPAQAHLVGWIWRVISHLWNEEVILGQ